MKKWFLLLLVGFNAGLLIAQAEDIRMFIFGHSLIDHRPPAIPTPSNETTVPHWVYLLAEAGGKSYAAGGQYGFLPQHANLPPISQWGYDLVPPVWESDTEPFSAADISTVLITAGNFMQWQAPDAEYPTDPGVSPVSATEAIIDWINLQEEGVVFYIYENWPDMAPFLGNGFPPSENELAQYHLSTQSSFHDWWIEYQDFLLQSLPEEKVRMIPVGPIISGLLTETLAGQLSPTELYEDDAPHGRPTLYFLAGLITYMAIYGEEAPSSFIPPETVSNVVQEQFEEITTYCWNALLDFNTAEGASRVFCELPSSIEGKRTSVPTIAVFPNPANGEVTVQTTAETYELTLFNLMGEALITYTGNTPIFNLPISILPKGAYILQLRNIKDGAIVSERIIKQ